MQLFSITESTFQIPSSAGMLEVVTQAPDVLLQAVTVIICHPHPLFGGTMNNKVVTTLAKTFRELGLRTVRFNFRGVGKSTGTHDKGRGELDDLFTVINGVKETYPHDSIWLAGFSFGAFVSISAASQVPFARLVSIAPPVSYFGSKDAPVIRCPWVVVQGDADEVVDPESVYAWIERLNPKPALIRMPTGHFFHGQLLDLKENLKIALTPK